MPNNFADLYRETGRRLFVTATNLDTAERVVFGPAHRRHEDERGHQQDGEDQGWLHIRP